jgi:hypothetical protein
LFSDVLFDDIGGHMPRRADIKCKADWQKTGKPAGEIISFVLDSLKATFHFAPMLLLSVTPARDVSMVTVYP